MPSSVVDEAEARLRLVSRIVVTRLPPIRRYVLYRNRQLVEV